MSAAPPMDPSAPAGAHPPRPPRAPFPRLRLAGAAGLALLTACGGDDPTGPPAVAAVTVSSPSGTRLAVGRTVQLVAVARDAQGNVVPGVAFAWSSSATTVAPVTGAGVASGSSVGNATIRASVGAVGGTIALQVKGADLAGIKTTVDDAYRVALSAALTTAVRGRTQAAFAECTAGEAAGDFGRIEACLASARAEVAGATDASDRAALATLALFLDHIERLLNL